jgi:peptidoglycan/xylan/chitin deacetylase (PgdA/CDA1 family)
MTLVWGRNMDRPIIECEEQCEGNPNAIKVLMYHRIVNDEYLSRSHWTCLHVNELRKQLKFIERSGYTTVTFEDYRLFLAGELNLPRKPVILTFDDGYLDTYEIAYPLLQEFGMKGVVFVLGDRSVETNNWDHHLKLPLAPLMRTEHIVELREMGFEIGAHSLRHSKLTEVSCGQAWEEISRSRSALEILLNSPVRTFSYPYGLVNCEVKRMVAEAGFSHACSVFSGPPSLGKDNYEIRRTPITGTFGLFGFALKLATPYQYYEWFQWKTKSAFRRNGSNHSGQSAPRLELTDH